MRRIRFFILLAVVFSVSFNGYSALKLAAGMPGISDWSTGLPFKDVMKQCRGWKAAKFNGETMHDGTIDAIPIDENHYPLEIPYTVNGTPLSLRTITLTDIPLEAYPYGTFTLMFEGTGEIEFRWDHTATYEGTGGTKTVTFDITEIPDPNTSTGNFTLSPRSKGMVIYIRRSDKSDPIKNIRLIMPDANGGTSYVDDYESQPFNPALLEVLRPYKTLRFMDWCGVNFNIDSLWSERTLPGALGQGHHDPFTPEDAAYQFMGVDKNFLKVEKEVAYEYMVQLCNIMGADLWINVPVKSDTHYRQQLAKLVYDNLDKDLKVYVEFGNECWNSLFVGYSYTIAKAQEKGIEGKNQWYKAWKYYSYEALECQRIFKEAFGAESGRITGLFASQVNQGRVMKEAIEGISDPATNPHGLKPDAIASTSYFSAPPTDGNGELPKYKQYRKWADSLGVPYLTYEGGRGSGSGPALYSLYLETFDVFEGLIDMFNQFVAVGQWGKSGHWGAREYVTQPLADAHKARAIWDYGLENNLFDPNKVLPRPGSVDNVRDVSVNGSSPASVRVTTHKGRAITVYAGKSDVMHVSVIDLQGRQKINRRFSGENRATIGTAQLNRGTYLVQVTAGNSTTTRRVVVR